MKTIDSTNLINAVVHRQDNPLKWLSKKHKFSFVWTNIVEYLVVNKHNLSDKEMKIFKSNINSLYSSCMSLVTKTMTFHLNTLYQQNQENIDVDFQTFYKEFEDAFISDYTLREDVFSTYPELFRLIYNFFDQSIHNIKESIYLVDVHYEELKNRFNIEEFGELSVILGEGDIHKSGKSTSRVSIGGKTLFLKWRECSFEKDFTRFQHKFLKNMGITNRINDLKEVEGRNYYFQESIEPEGIFEEEHNDHYYQLGIFISIAYLLGVTDLHYENIIIANGSIIAIDCETIATSNEREIAEYIDYDLAKSVYSTYILPFNTVKGAVLAGISSLSSQTMYANDYKIKITNRGIDLANSPLKTISNPNSKKDKSLYFLHTNEIIKGFEEGYIEFLKNKNQYVDLLKTMLANKKHRVLKKNTYDYNTLLWESYHPYLMTSYEERYKFFEKNSLLNKEEQILLYNGEIPYIEEFINLQEKYFDKFSYDDLKRQKVLIKESLAFDKVMYLTSNKKKNLLAESTVEECDIDKYKDYLLLNSIVDNWISAIETGVTHEDTNTEYKELELNIMPDTLYLGKSGVIKFLWAYYDRKPNKEEEIWFKSVLKSMWIKLKKHIMKNPKIQIGFYDGIGGLLHTMYFVNKKYSIFHDKELIQILMVIKKNISYDTQFDVISGSAGLLNALIDMYHDSGSKDLKKQLFDCINGVETHLIIHFDDINCGWSFKNPSDPNDTFYYYGYSHGLSGIIPQLYRSFLITNNDQIKQLVDKSVKKIIMLYNDSERNWPTSSAVDTYYTNWCHGSPGVIYGLGMLLKNGYVSKEINNIIYEVLLRLVREEKPNLCLCHGSYGNDLIGKYCSEIIGNNKLKKDFERKLDDNWLKLLNTDNIITVNKSYMTGITGIYYWKLNNNNLDNIF
ncbi:hypothetical protein BW425_26750 [Bacillus pseudomycoides]|uniref:Lantibiotic biosynthesis protein dehydration domain-containing protein n=2 Tax=Bacillus pseudomycoides TaxID=64104 RepID=A0A1Y3MAL5_9BACI|nr:DUF4135 domain-containing protein [Bacillus pseudomycoides]OUM45911.1 hypothetical protein BW425_26750 [Bacillus pseudomycoides]